MLKKGRVSVAALSLVLLLTTTAGASPRPVRVGVVLKGLDNPFFVAMYEGVRAEVKHRNAVASFRAATNVDDPAAGQAARARTLARAGKHDCFVLNPISSINLVPAFRSVRRPIVNVDSPVDPVAARRAGMRIVTYIGTDDGAVGQLAAATMKAALGGRGDIALVGGYGVNSKRRLDGFSRGLEGTRIVVIARVNAGYNRAKAQLATRRILREHPDVVGFFAANDEMALGIAEEVQAASKRGVVKVIGVDAIPSALDAVRAGRLTGTVAQYPYVMGRMAIEACVAAAHGAKLPQRVKTPIVLVTKQNVAKATAAFPMPPRPYADPFARLLGSRR